MGKRSVAFDNRSYEPESDNHRQGKNKRRKRTNIFPRFNPAELTNPIERKASNFILRSWYFLVLSDENIDCRDSIWFHYPSDYYDFKHHRAVQENILHIMTLVTESKDANSIPSYDVVLRGLKNLEQFISWASETGCEFYQTIPECVQHGIGSKGHIKVGVWVPSKEDAIAWKFYGLDIYWGKRNGN